MVRSIIHTFFLTVMFSVAVFAQRDQPVTPQATPTPDSPPKANHRPPEKPAAEPFDKADVATMAAKCVDLDTEAGLIEMEFFPESAPESVRNFLNLVATRAYDTTVFSRVVSGFVVQGGDLYTRDGKITYALGMRARRTIPDEPSKILHERGIVSMARSDEPNTASTHFFILVDAAPSLDGKFAAFGRVTRGMDVVDTINKVPVENEKPTKPVRIKKATVNNCTSSSPSN